MPTSRAAPARSRTGRPRGTGRGWREATPAPVVVVSGPESLLADRAVTRIVRALRQQEPDLSPVRVEATSTRPGEVTDLTSPSLFGDRRLVVVGNLAEVGETVQSELLDYLATPDDTVTLVLLHAGGTRGKKVLDAALAAGAQVVDVPAVKRDDERLAFVGEEFAEAGRRVESRAAQALVDAFGSDLRELASACAQLTSDVPGDIDEAVVRRYYGGRAEATGFEVADAVAVRDTGAALLAVRRALDSGVDPIPLLAAIAARLRGIAKVAAVQGTGAQVAAELGMAPWQVDKSRRELRRWSPVELGHAIDVLAQADVALKGGLVVRGVARGGSTDHTYTLERTVLDVCQGVAG